jgi:hypothetical protein
MISLKKIIHTYYILHHVFIIRKNLLSKFIEYLIYLINRNGSNKQIAWIGEILLEAIIVADVIAPCVTVMLSMSFCRKNGKNEDFEWTRFHISF